MEEVYKKLQEMEDKVLLQGYKNTKKLVKDLLRVQDRLYVQLESLSWLQRRLAIKGQLPPLRGWAASPDVLLRLHSHIMATCPRVVVEFGSGASTLVIADALRQNGIGQLVSLEHSEHYGAQTLGTLKAESLQSWVDIRIGELVAWDGDHLNSANTDEPCLWYSKSHLEDIECIEMIWVDGPPAATCQFARYPALPALFERLTTNAQIWMDDTFREEEKDICQRWAEDYGFDLEYISLEKGLGVLSRK